MEIKMTWKCGCTILVPEKQIAERFLSVEHAQSVYGNQRCAQCDYNALYPEEKAHFDAAVAKARQLNNPFTERDVLQPAWNEGYELHLGYDPRFVKTEGRRDNFPLWTLA